MKLKETITAPIPVLITYLLYLGCFATPVARQALSRTGDYSLISGVVLEVLTLLLPALIYAKCKGVGYSAQMHFMRFSPSRLIFALCMLVFALSGVILLFMLLHGTHLIEAKYPLTDTYALALSERELPVLLRCISYAVLPAFAEEFLYRGVLFTEYRQSGIPAAMLFSSALFALGQFSPQRLPAFFLLGLASACVYYVTESLPTAVLFRLAFNLLVFYFEDAAWTLILRRANFVFFLCFCGVLLLLSAVLALSEAQRIFYTRALDGEKTPPEGKLKTGGGARLLAALLSPTLILCVAASIAIMLLL